ncbi:hypothetical protein COHA_009274 [Chlorella ohadii]|uniref:Uncharacterized protein n=1 Tax=Chlorella ohadii TaxID=2649997 RepID=A0AAD5DIF4_9CHLO|nr:hypothetical protein COHA_009274 [Chlorella ohadii]
MAGHWRSAAATRSTAPSGGGRPDHAASAASTPPAQTPGSGWRTFWTAVDASAWLGTVGASVAFVLTQEAMLVAAPIALPLLALYASRQRERLVAADESARQLARLEELLLDMQAETADEVAAEVGAEVQDLLKAAVAAAAQRGGATNGEVAQLVRTTTRDALAQSAERQGQLANSVMSRLQDLGTALRRDVNGALTAAGADEAAALGRLEARLASLEGAIGGLQAAQADGLRRLNTGLAAAVDDAQATLEAAVRDEAARSLDPLRRLPELVAAAMPVTPEVLGPDSSLPAVSEESLRALLGEQLREATQRILEQQEALLEELAGQPQVIAPQQWTQLGGRLAFLQEQLEQLAALQQQQAAAAAEASSSASAPAAAVAAVSAELAGLRSELGSLSTSVRQLLEAQVQQAVQQASAPVPAGSAAASALPPGALAGVAAALQAVQDQVILLRQDLDEGDSKYAAFRALEEQLEVALTALFEALAVADTSAIASGWTGEAPGSGSAGAAAAATAAMEQQQAALAAALESLGALGGRLDGMAEQMASLQASLAASPAQPAAAQPSLQQAEPAAAQLPAAGTAAQQAPEEAWEGQQGSATAPADQAADAAGGEDAQAAAYQRMQQLLQQRNEERPGGAADEVAASGGRAFAEWLSGHRENAEPAAVAAPSAEALLAAAGAAEAGAPASAASAASDGSAGVQQQIGFAAAMGLAPEEQQPAAAAADGEPSAWVPPSAAAAVEDAAASAPAYDARLQAGSSVPAEAAAAPAADAQLQAQEQQWYAAAQAEAAWQQQPYASEQPQQQPYYAEQPQQQPYYAEQPQQQPYAAEQPAPQYQQPADQLQPQQPQQPVLQQLTAEQLYERGVQRLREGRALAATPGADLGLADAALWEAEEAFEALLAQQPDNIRALGNYGNTLNAHGKLKKQMMDAVAAAAAPADAAQAAAVNAAQERLAAEAKDLLLLAGRKYKEVLELDPNQAKAYINWGRVVGLRAEMARAAGNLEEGARLFSRAADKFDAAIDIEQRVEAYRLGGQSLLDAVVCLAGYNPTEAKQLAKDAVQYFENALDIDPSDVEAAAGLERARAELAVLRAAQRSAQAAQQ